MSDIMPPMTEMNNPPIEDEELEEELITFTLRRPTIWISVFIPLAFALGLGIGYLAWGQGDVPGNAQQAAQGGQAATPGTGEARRYEVPINDDDPVRGPEDAPVTIIEFSDYECPFCKRYFEQVAVRIWEDYEDEVRYVFKNFPLTSMHPNARPAAEASLCAHDQDAFWEFHDKLFTTELDLGKDTYLQFAEDLDLDMEKFSECVGEGRYSERVQEDLDFALNLGVSSTPTFLINGIPVIGAQPYDVFVQVIESELEADK